MATQHGHETYNWLLARGWKETPISFDPLSDLQVVDPQTGKQIDVYSAAKLQKDRTGDYPDFLKG